MKKLVVLSLVAIVLASSAIAVTLTPCPSKRPDNTPRDGQLPINANLERSSKALFDFVAIGKMGYADAWRTIAAMNGKSIVVSPGGDSIMVVYSQYSKNANKPSNVFWASSTDGGATWPVQYPVVNDRQIRTYSGLAAGPDFTPFIIWQDWEDANNQPPYPIVITYDAMGFGGGMWGDYTHLTDSIGFYIPSLAIDGNTLLCSGTANLGGNGSLHMARADLSDLAGSGIVWSTPWNLSSAGAINGWYEWLDDPNDDQDAACFAMDPAGDAVVAFNEAVLLSHSADAQYCPMFTYSNDDGVNWPSSSSPGGAVAAPVYAPDSLFPSYSYGGWWYNYDAIWHSGKPHFVYNCSDWGYNYDGLIYSTPVAAGDYTAWKHQIIDYPGTSNYGLGYSAVWPSFSADDAGNLYITFAEDGAALNLLCAASTDNGNTWHQPYRAYEGGLIGYPEAAAKAADGKVHFIAYDYGLADTLYYGSINTANVLAMPVVDPMEAPTPIQFGTPLADAAIDTLRDADFPGDTLDFVWTPSVDPAATYEIQVSSTETFDVGTVWTRVEGTVPTNYFLYGVFGLGNIGLPFNGMVYWRVRANVGTSKAQTAWSDIYKLCYEGTILNTTDWVITGVAGNPTQPTYKFALNQNRPNPARGTTTLSFQLPKAGAYTMKIFNVAGQVVKEFSGQGKAGANNLTWNPGKTANGVYFYQLASGGNIATKKLVVVK